MSVVSSRWGGGGAFAGMCHGVAKTVGGEQGIDWFGRVQGVGVSHSVEEVFNFGDFGNSTEINGSVENGVAVRIVSKWAKLGGDGTGDEGGVGSLFEMILTSGDECFVQGLLFNDSGPRGMFQVNRVVRGQYSIEGDVFGGFEAYAKAFEDGGLAFGSNQLSEGSGFFDVPCVGQVLGTVLKEGIPDLFSILLDLSEKSVGFLYLRFGLYDGPCTVH